MGYPAYLPVAGLFPTAGRLHSLLRDANMSGTCQSKHRNTRKTADKKRTLEAKPDEQEKTEGEDSGNGLQRFDPMRSFADSSITTRLFVPDYHPATLFHKHPPRSRRHDRSQNQRPAS